ncbi:MAG: B12-binding domain-containing radical SAM protein [Candidatus Hodarchaeota archaeon]
MARISLINPAPVYFDELGIQTRQYSWPPLGLLYLGEILSREGHYVKIYDQDVTGATYEEVVDWIKDQEPDILGISPLTVSLDSGVKIAELAKKWNENLIIVFGNVMATLAYKQFLENFDFIDYCIRGEAEHTLPKFVDIIIKGKDIKDTLGVAYRENGVIKTTPDPPLIRDLDEIPIPDRKKLIDFNYTLGSHKFTILASSRGCPYTCKFCGVHLVPNSRGIWRPRSVDGIMEELHFLKSKGYEEFAFVDDCFTVSRNRTLKLCWRMKKEKIDMDWSCEGRIDQGSREVLRTMKIAGCNSLMMGIESANQRILDQYNKNITPELSRKVIKNVKKAGIEIITGLFVVGAPGETIQEIINTLRFGLKLDLTFIQYQLLHVLYGTEIWHDYVQKGLIDPEKDWNKYLIAADIDPNVVKRETIEKLINKAFIEFVSRPKYILREMFRTTKSPYRLGNIISMRGKKI